MRAPRPSAVWALRPVEDCQRPLAAAVCDACKATLCTLLTGRAHCRARLRLCSELAR